MLTPQCEFIDNTGSPISGFTSHILLSEQIDIKLQDSAKKMIYCVWHRIMGSKEGDKWIKTLCFLASP